MKTLLMAIMIVAVVASCSAAETVAATVAAEYPYICSGALRDAVLADLSDEMVAQCEGITVTREDLEAQVGKSPASTLEQVRKYPVYALEQYLTKRLMLIEAKGWAKASGQKDITDGELVQRYLDSKIPKFEVNDKEAWEFYAEHASMFGSSSYEQIKDMVIYVVRDQKISDAQAQFAGSAGKRHKILVSASWMRTQHERWAKNPAEKARLSGKPTYVNFGVNGCCDHMNPVTQALSAEYGDRLNVVFVHVGEQEILGELYGINTVPIQFLFDKNGKLLLRHVGNLTKEQVLAKFAEGGVDISKGDKND